MTSSSSDFVVAARSRRSELLEQMHRCVKELHALAEQDDEFACQLESDWYRKSADSHRAYAAVILRDIEEWVEKLVAGATGTSSSYFSIEYEKVYSSIMPKLVIAGASYFAWIPESLCQNTLGSTPLSDLVAPNKQEKIRAMTPTAVTAWIASEMAVKRDGVMQYKLDCLLPSISGEELLALTPNQLGIRLAIDGVSPVVQTKMVANLLQ
jgi:hypothetical protein